MNKKVTIVASTSIEPFIVQRISEMGQAEFRAVPATAVEGYEGLFKHSYESRDSKSKLEESLQTVKRKLPEKAEQSSSLDDKILRSFAYNSEKTIKELAESLAEFSKKLDTARAPYDKVRRLSANDLETQKTEFDSKKHELSQQALITRAKAKSLQALNPDELKKCITAGVVSQINLGELEEHLKSSGVDYKAEPLSEEEVLVFIFGSNDILKRVNNLFTVYDVNEIYEVFASGELLLVLNEDMHAKTLESYTKKIEELNKSIQELEEKNKAAVKVIETKYGSDLSMYESEFLEQVSLMLEDYGSKIATSEYIVDYLETYSDLPVMRNPVFSILQVWFDDSEKAKLETILKELQGKDTDLLYKIEEISAKELKEASKKD